MISWNTSLLNTVIKVSSNAPLYSALMTGMLSTVSIAAYIALMWSFAVSWDFLRCAPALWVRAPPGEFKGVVFLRFDGRVSSSQRP